MPRTREQDRLYQREYKRRRAAESYQAGSAGSTVEMVESELASMPNLPAASVAVALAMARVLDDASAVPQHPAAAGQLRQVMGELRAVKAPADASRLAVLRGGRTG